VSLAVFFLSFTHLFPWQDLLILIGVLFLHELGHFAAMRSFGYENTSIFFLPFFGAATSGRKDHATLSEKVMVVLWR
jgi:Zn-dependent protease